MQFPHFRYIKGSDLEAGPRKECRYVGGTGFAKVPNLMVHCLSMASISPSLSGQILVQ